MLWFNFILGLNFISFFYGMVVYDNELKQRETKDKIEPQHMQLVGENINTQDVLLALIAFFSLIVHGGHAT